MVTALTLIPLGLLWAQARLRKSQAQVTQLQAQLQYADQSSEVLGAQLGQREAALQETSHKLQLLEQRHAGLEARVAQERMNYEEKIRTAGDLRNSFSETFKSLSFDALKQNNQAFLDLAKNTLSKFQEGAQGDLAARQKEIASLVQPVKDALTSVDQKIQALEKERVSAYHVLRQQVQELVTSQNMLKSETSNLVQALKTPSVRGRWGEMQLKRVVEMAGMLAYCDFMEQVHNGEGEQKMRPDMIVRLPGGKQIIVDAKAPLHAYLEAMGESDETVRLAKMKEHARQVRNHITALSRRGYWEQFEPTPDFVILFLPGEMFFSAALEQDPSLIESGVQERVILATPTTLIAMLRAVAYGWRQESLAASAKEVGEMGQELYRRLSDMGQHFRKLGRHLGQTVESYNQSVGSLERRVMVTARKFQDLETTSTADVIEEVKPLEQMPRSLTAVELLAENDTLKELIEKDISA
jgi:DNA recombination protein RmuC